MRDDLAAKSITVRASAIPSTLPHASPGPILRSEAAFSAYQMAHVVVRRKATIILSTLVMMGLAITAWCVLTPKYESVATLQINKEDTDALGLDSVSAGSTAGADALEFNITMGTHAKALETDTLALQVIEQLRLDQLPEFQPKPSRFDPPETKAEVDKPLENAPHKRDSMLKTFHRRLKVDAITGTRLIQVRFKDPDPQLAADVANAVTNDYIEQNFRTRYTATAQVSDWLSKQLNQLKNQMTDSDQKLVDFETKTGILGSDGATDVVLSKLEDLNKKLTEAEDNRITRQAIYELVKTGNPELVSGLAGNSFSSTGLTGQNPLENLQRLREQEAQVKLQYAEAAKKFGSAYPKLVELDSQLRMLESEIRVELQKIAKRAENDYLAAQSAEVQLSSLFAKQKEGANRLNDKAVQLSLLKQEAESNRELYDDLQRKLKSAVVLSGLRSTNMVVVDPARPSVDPVRPLIFFVTLGIASGLLAGIALAFGKEVLDTTVRNPDQAKALTFLPELGLIPDWRSVSLGRAARKMIEQSTKPVALLAWDSILAEAYRQLRTSIYVSAAGAPKVLMVASPMTKDGKTMIAINLAAVLAQQRAKVLLVDADLRRPSIHARLRSNASRGLAAILADPSLPPPGCIVESPDQPGLFVLADRIKGMHTAELLGSGRMTSLLQVWRKEFDYVILDSSPVLSATDAVVLSQKVDSVLLVVRSETTSQAALLRCRDLLQRTGANIAGVVVNGVNVKSSDYGQYYGERYTAKSSAEHTYGRLVS